MDLFQDPSSLVLTTALFAATLYLVSPRLFRYLFISVGLSTWRTTNTTVKDVIASCAKFQRWEFGTYCKIDMAVFGGQIVVFTVAVMCTLMEVEHIVRRRGHREEVTMT